jgi:DNA excision repair protein ERCC-2
MTASWVRNRAGVGRFARGEPEAPVEMDIEDAAGPSERPARRSDSIMGRNNTKLCRYFEQYDSQGNNADIPSGIYSLDDLKSLGKTRGWCPYFLARQLVNHANIVVYNYQYLLDPKISNMVSRDIQGDSIVVFDEGHNIDNICIEALSVTLNRRSLDASVRCVSKLQNKVMELKVSDTERLAREYRDLVTGLAEQGIIRSGPDSVLANPVLPEDILQEAVPGNIRKAEHFVTFLKKIVDYFKRRMKGLSVEVESPNAFVLDFVNKTALERKPLRFTYSRLNSLLRTLEITSVEEFNPLLDVANFATLVATYSEGFAVIMEPNGSIVAGIQEPLLQLCCLDASLAIKPVLQKFHSVIITSGTLSPIDFYPKILNFHPVIRASLPMSTFRPCLLPLVVTRGNDQVTMSTRFETRRDLAVLRNYGNLLLETAAKVPDGICCFFTSYQYMEFVVAKWDEMRILQKVTEHKLLFFETKDVVETTLALDNFKRACDCGRGAVFLSVARGKVAEGIDFDRHYGRCVILFGVPFQYTESFVLRARLDFMHANYQIHDNDFLTFDALRQAAQCIGRVIRSKTDYGLVILADSRFGRHDKRSKLPPWINQFLRDHNLNLSIDTAVDQVKLFVIV